MPQTHPPYASEFREQMIALAKSGRSVSSLSEEFKVSDQTIRNWLKQTDLDTGSRTDGLATAEREELRRLRAENKRLQQERDILAKAERSFG